MKNKTYRFAVVAALLLALALVFAAPVGADGVVEVSTFDDLKSNLTNGNSVKLVSDIELTATLTIPEGKVVTLNLNEYNITHTKECTASYSMIDNKGSLTIIGNGKISFKDTGVGDPSYGWGSYTIRNSGTLVVGEEGGNAELTIEHIGEQEFAEHCIIAIFQYSGSTTINDGTISTPNYRSVRLWKGDMTINGGNFDGQVWVQCVDNSAKLLITDGTFEPNGRDMSSVFVENSAYDAEFAVINGNFKTKIGVSNADKLAKSITGGTFTTSAKENTNAALLDDEYVFVEIEEGTYEVQEKKPGISADVSSVSFGTVQEGYTPTTATVTLTNTGNTKTDFNVEGVSEYFTISCNPDTSTLEVDASCVVSITPEGELTAGTYSETLTIQVGTESSIEIPVTIIVIKPIVEEEKETTVVPELPPVSVQETDDGETKSIVVDTSNDKVTITPSRGEGEGADDKATVSITASSPSTSEEDESAPSVTVVITNVKQTGNTLELTEDSEVSAEYTDVKSETSESAPEQQKVSFDISIPLKTVNTTTLPVFSGKYDNEIVEKIPEKDDDGNKITPLAMFTATKNADEVNKNLKGDSKSITVTFYITDKLGGKFVAFHVKNGELIGEPIEATVGEYVDGKGYPVTITVSGFSSYVLAEVQETETIDGNTGGSGKNTGSGNYQYYPREVTADGIIDFGTSKVVTGMELPAGSSGKVTLNTKPTFAMPENGFYAFEIDAPGYNLDAKINGGLSFQIPLADLEAAGYTAKDIVLYHGTVAEDGKITWEALLTNLVKNENGIAYYKSAINGCSPFYIGFVKDGSVVNTEVVEPVTPPTETPDVPGTDLPEIPDVQDEPETPATPAPVLGVLAALGAAVVLRRK